MHRAESRMRHRANEGGAQAHIHDSVTRWRSGKRAMTRDAVAERGWVVGPRSPEPQARIASTCATVSRSSSGSICAVICQEDKETVVRPVVPDPAADRTFHN